MFHAYILTHYPRLFNTVGSLFLSDHLSLSHEKSVTNFPRHPIRNLFLLACRSGGKIWWYQGTEDHNTDNLLPSLFSSSLLRSRLGSHLLLLACRSGGKIWWYQGTEDHNTDNLLPSLFSSSLLRSRLGWTSLFSQWKAFPHAKAGFGATPQLTRLALSHSSIRRKCHESVMDCFSSAEPCPNGRIAR
jgi:hypothetical protein